MAPVGSLLAPQHAQGRQNYRHHDAEAQDELHHGLASAPLLTGNDRAWLMDDEPDELNSIGLGNMRDARPVIRTTMVRPATIFSEKDMFMILLRSDARPRQKRCQPWRASLAHIA
jgi:hypothetical protein